MYFDYNTTLQIFSYCCLNTLSLTQKIIRKATGMQSMQGLKDKIGTRLRETYYNASVLHRIEDKIAPLQLDIDANAPVRINLLIPEIDFRTFYGGYIAKFNLAQKLMDKGFKVRFVMLDPCKVDESAWRDMVAQYDGIENIFDQVEYAYCYDRSKPLKVSPHDKIIATTWWTAYVAHDMAGKLGIDKFFYLIQEYEPFTFAMGSYFAIAAESYKFPHRAIFSSPQLHDYFQQKKIGIFGEPWGDANEAMPFENAILRFDQSALIQNRQTDNFKLLFYARPEAHASRNMFEIAYLALARAIEQGHFDHAKWEFHGIGSSHGDIPLPRGNTLKMLGKFGLKEYKQRLMEYDLGLSLMYTPHPSLLPLEMAAAGMWVVSNECENKTTAELHNISSNLIAAQPTIAGVTEKIAETAVKCSDHQARLEGAKVNWASSWHDTFNDDVLSQIIQWLNIRS